MIRAPGRSHKHTKESVMALLKKVPSGCWEAQKKHTGFGYVQVKVDMKVWLLHRYIYTVCKGPIPKGMMVCHSCDNRKCANPEHLWLGNAFDNMGDAAKKGRMPRGERAQLARLKNSQVLEIYKDRSLGAYNAAKKYGVSSNAIYRIRKGWTWRHITKAPEPTGPRV